MVNRLIKKAVDACTTWASHRAIDLGLKHGQRKYVRFVVVGTGRSGSNFLRGLLNAHPAALALGEIFREHGRIGWDIRGYPRSRKVMTLFERQPARFIEQVVYRRYPGGLNAVGFKLFYHHARDESWAPVWDYLKDDKDIRVIHLKRKNLLKVHLSQCKADRTGRWINTRGVREATEPIELDHDGCLAMFEETRSDEEACDRLFAEHELLGMSYEDLTTDEAGQIVRVQTFLGLPSMPVKPSTYKQSSLPLIRSISNYEDLRRRFAGTPWEGYFED